MEFKKLTDNVQLPVLGFGTWGIGGWTERDTTHDKEDILAIKTAIKLGLNHIDTAEFYGNGHAEELIKEVIKDMDRKKMFITSKVSGDNLKYDEVISACKKSLKRLGIRYLDLYLIHWYNEDVPLEETMRAMDDLVEEGLVKLIGVSNFSVEQMKEAQKYSKNKIVANQIEYNLLTRNKGLWNNNMESEILPYCQKNNIMFIAWRPLGKGRLFTENHPILDEICKKYNKTKSQVAINWLISKPGVVTIFKSRNIDHIKDNIGALGWKLDEEDIRKLDGGI